MISLRITIIGLIILGAGGVLFAGEPAPVRKLSPMMTEIMASMEAAQLQVAELRLRYVETIFLKRCTDSEYFNCYGRPAPERSRGDKVEGAARQPRVLVRGDYRHLTAQARCDGASRFYPAIPGSGSPGDTGPSDAEQGTGHRPHDGVVPFEQRIGAPHPQQHVDLGRVLHLGQHGNL